MDGIKTGGKMVLLFVLLFSFFGCGENEPEPEVPTEEIHEVPLKVGYGLALGSFTAAKLKYAKSVGVSSVEVAGTGLLVDENRYFKLSDADIVKKLTQAKKDADEAGIEIWSVHMPFGEKIDISIRDEGERQEVVAMHKKLIGFLKILKPKIILFHPSYYLALNERDIRKSQMLKSANELNEAVQAINSTMVLENMLGPNLLSGSRERPLMRTVAETEELFQRLPASIGLAVDMNHIKNPENLIRAMGSRLKTVHIADGTGEAENHFFPCSGEGKNNWSEILAALEEVNYKGPFMYESDYEDEKEFMECYELLYNNYKKK